MLTLSSRSSRPVRRLILSLAAAAMAALSMAGTASAVTTTHQSGHVGYWTGFDGTNACSNRSIQTLLPYVTSSPAYPNSTQTVYMIPRLDYSADGTNWTTYDWGTWQSRRVDGYKQLDRFRSDTLDATGGGYYWRVAMHFQWYVGSTRVGEVVNVFNAGREYFGAGTVAHNSTAYFCKLA